MPGNWHVRFGERRAETSRREAVWRCAPTLPLSLSSPHHCGLDGDRLAGGERRHIACDRSAAEDGAGATLLFREE